MRLVAFWKEKEDGTNGYKVGAKILMHFINLEQQDGIAMLPVGVRTSCQIVARKQRC